MQSSAYPSRRRRYRRVAALAVACSAAALTAAGCSSSSTSSATTPASTSSTPAGTSSTPATGSSGTSSSPATSAATGSTITIGTVASITGPYAASIGGTPNTVTAWVDYTNAHGGVNGHPVKDVVLDDGSVPSKGIADAKELIADHVSAIVGSASNTEFNWYQLVTKAGIPVIGGQTNGGALYQTIAGLYPTGTTSTVPAFDIATKAGKNKLAILYCSEVPVCAAITTTIKSTLAADAKQYPKLSIVYTAAIAAAAPSYTAQCLAAQQAGADSLLVEDGAATTVRVIDGCASQGFKPALIGTGAEADNTWLKDANFNGVDVYQEDFPWFATSTPAEQAFQSALKQYAPSELTAVTFNPNDSQVWAALEVFAAAVEKAKPATVTSATVTAAITALPANFTVADVTPPLTYKSGPNPNVDCYFLVQIDGGKWTVPGNGAPICPAGS